MLRGKPHELISHPEEDAMMLRGCAIHSEAREGSQAFELKTLSNEVGGPKQVCRPSLNQKTISWQPAQVCLASRKKGARLPSSTLATTD